MINNLVTKIDTKSIMEKVYLKELEYLDSFPKELKYYVHFPCKMMIITATTNKECYVFIVFGYISLEIYFGLLFSLSLFIDILHASVVVMFLLRYKKCKQFIQYAIDYL